MRVGSTGSDGLIAQGRKMLACRNVADVTWLRSYANIELDSDSHVRISDRPVLRPVSAQPLDSTLSQQATEDDALSQKGGSMEKTS